MRSASPSAHHRRPPPGRRGAGSPGQPMTAASSAGAPGPWRSAATSRPRPWRSDPAKRGLAPRTRPAEPTAGIGVRPAGCGASAHPARTGQRPQAGRTGAGTRVAPRSSRAWFHAQPRPSGHGCVGATLHLAAAAGAGRPWRARTRADVRVQHADVGLEGEGQHRPGGVRPDAGQGQQRRPGRRGGGRRGARPRRHPPPATGSPPAGCSRDRPPQLLHHVAGRRGGAGGRRGEAGQEGVPAGHDPVDLGLLEHHLADQHRPRVTGLPPRQVAGPPGRPPRQQAGVDTPVATYASVATGVTADGAQPQIGRCRRGAGGRAVGLLAGGRWRSTVSGGSRFTASTGGRRGAA